MPNTRKQELSRVGSNERVSILVSSPSIDTLNNTLKIEVVHKTSQLRSKVCHYGTNFSVKTFHVHPYPNMDSHQHTIDDGMLYGRKAI